MCSWIQVDNSRRPVDSVENPGKVIYLKPGLRQQNLGFAKPGETSFGGKKVESVIEAPEERTRVQYDEDGQKLTRKLVVG